MRGKVRFGIVFCLMAACTGLEIIADTPESVTELRTQPSAQYAATVGLAQTLSNRCVAFDYNVDLARDIDAQRAAVGTNLAIAGTRLPAVDLERDVATRSLLARYEVAAFEGPDLCAIAAGEVARASALGALLQPA